MPTETSDHAPVRVHPPVLWLLFVGAAVLLQRAVPLSVTSMIARWAGLLLATVGILPALLAIWHFYRARTTLHPHGSVKVLLTEGPYRYSRNPIYLAYLACLIGLPLAAGSWWGALLAPVFVPAMNRLVISAEEEYLRKKFPGDFARFSARVRRWI